ncbi:hypothetical protein WDU94_009975 [Cyamophila willieti]
MNKIERKVPLYTREWNMNKIERKVPLYTREWNMNKIERKVPLYTREWNMNKIERKVPLYTREWNMNKIERKVPLYTREWNMNKIERKVPLYTREWNMNKIERKVPLYTREWNMNKIERKVPLYTREWNMNKIERKVPLYTREWNMNKIERKVPLYTREWNMNKIERKVPLYTREWNMNKIERKLMGFPDYYRIKKEDHPEMNDSHSNHMTLLLINHDQILWAQQQVSKRRDKRHSIDSIPPKTVRQTRSLENSNPSEPANELQSSEQEYHPFPSKSFNQPLSSLKEPPSSFNEPPKQNLPMNAEQPVMDDATVIEVSLPIDKIKEKVEAETQLNKLNEEQTKNILTRRKDEAIERLVNVIKEQRDTLGLNTHALKEFVKGQAKAIGGNNALEIMKEILTKIDKAASDSGDDLETLDGAIKYVKRVGENDVLLGKPELLRPEIERKPDDSKMNSKTNENGKKNDEHVLIEDGFNNDIENQGNYDKSIDGINKVKDKHELVRRGIMGGRREDVIFNVNHDLVRRDYVGEKKDDIIFKDGTNSYEKDELFKSPQQIETPSNVEIEHSVINKVGGPPPITKKIADAPSIEEYVAAPTFRENDHKRQPIPLIINSESRNESGGDKTTEETLKSEDPTHKSIENDMYGLNTRNINEDSKENIFNSEEPTEDIPYHYLNRRSQHDERFNDHVERSRHLHEYERSDHEREETNRNTARYVPVIAEMITNTLKIGSDQEFGDNGNSRYSEIFNDTKWSDQWYVQDYRKDRELPVKDLNVVPVYSYYRLSGRGIRIVIPDDGLEHTHEDLKPNYIMVTRK